MKRMTSDGDGDFLPAKRQRLVADSASPTTDQTDPDVVFDDGSEYDDDDDDDDASSGPAQTPLTSVSAASTPRFPSDLKTIKCTVSGCTKTFNRPARLAAHLRSHTNERPFRCSHPGCDKTYIEEKHLKQHVKGSHSSERQHTCLEPGCGKSFLTSTRLRRHQAVHEGQERFRCREFPPCNQSFRKHQTLQRHIRMEHLKVSAYPCTQDGCKAAFETSWALRRHNLRDHSELRFWCDECGGEGDDDGGKKDAVGFATIELLQKHMQKAHINCMFCDRVFSARSALENHIEKQHSKSTLTERKNVFCTFPGCNKSFVKKSNLQTHVRSAHEGQRFICGKVDFSGVDDLNDWSQAEGCGHGFTTKANLELHVRHVHIGIARPQPKASSKQMASDVLGDLSATRSVRKTIPCPAGCGFKFANQTDLVLHMQTEHGRLEKTAPDNYEGLNPFRYDDTELPLGSSAVDDLPNLSALEDFNASGGEFWIGANLESEVSHAGPDQEWIRDEADMRRLIDSNELEALIDPEMMQN